MQQSRQFWFLILFFLVCADPSVADAQPHPDPAIPENVHHEMATVPLPLVLTSDWLTETFGKTLRTWTPVTDDNGKQSETKVILHFSRKGNPDVSSFVIEASSGYEPSLKGYRILAEGRTTIDLSYDEDDDALVMQARFLPRTVASTKLAASGGSPELRVRSEDVAPVIREKEAAFQSDPDAQVPVAANRSLLWIVSARPSQVSIISVLISEPSGEILDGSQTGWIAESTGNGSLCEGLAGTMVSGWSTIAEMNEAYVSGSALLLGSLTGGLTEGVDLATYVSGLYEGVHGAIEGSLNELASLACLVLTEEPIEVDALDDLLSLDELLQTRYERVSSLSNCPDGTSAEAVKEAAGVKTVTVECDAPPPEEGEDATICVEEKVIQKYRYLIKCVAN